ncbi:MAG: glycoside hydrolase family 130 protein [Candidatus Margulisbacteria bacterium]|nr:glycoside hydrolase family 130 protein [Candidatus Margulisiibacteriota bacterium]
MTHSKQGLDIIHRWEGNPLIELEDLPFKANAVLNTGVACQGDEVILLIRYEDLAGYSKFVVGRSKDGFHFEIENKPFMEPMKDGPYEEYEQLGIEDPRITFLDGHYYILYTAHSNNGHRIGIARTKDFKSVERISLITEPDSKNGMLFPKKIDDKYCMLFRPAEGGNIWIAYSEDLVYWGDLRVAVENRGGGRWDGKRIGASVPPIEIKEGWLLIYYGVKETMGYDIFRLGACILDKEKPYKVIGRSGIPILTPREPYERMGDVPNMVFSCGACVDHHTNELRIFYGASHTCISLGTVPLQSIVDTCLGKE